MGPLLAPTVSTLVAGCTRRAAAPADDERHADPGTEHSRRAYRGRGSVDAERRQKEVVVGGRAHGDAKEVAIGADDEAAALELPRKRPGLRRPNDHEVRVGRRRVESGREESGGDALPFRRRRTELRLDLSPLSAALASVAELVGIGAGERRALSSAVPLAEGAALLLGELDGPDKGRVGADLEQVSVLLAGARERELAEREEDIERLWAARRALSPGITRSAGDFVFEDVCVPIAAVPEALRRIGDIAERYALRIPVFSHAGDGNLHPSILYDAAAGDQAERTHAAERDFLRAALELGGTISASTGSCC